jgi:hypothetical protein
MAEQASAALGTALRSSTVQARRKRGSTGLPQARASRVLLIGTAILVTGTALGTTTALGHARQPLGRTLGRAP